ncbi:MAG TPA: ABC transporter permease subunit, partial [Terriglobales bacterium]|nr:ABC transporter permease subunit [Terriglobales bacterium]
MKQLWAVFRLEIHKTFLGRRSWWIYLLALAPLLLFVGYSVQARWDSGLRKSWAAHNTRPLTAADFAAIHPGMGGNEVLQRLGPPARHMSIRRRRRDARDAIVATWDSWYRYSDGSTLYTIVLRDGAVSRVRSDPAPTLDQLASMFASVFQFFYLRLAVFFGCLGIFMNLFRGELLDKSLHFYFLAPVRREVVMAGKFLAGLTAAVVIFTASEGLQTAILAAQTGHGLAHVGTYLGVTVLACLGYGAVFLAAGLLFKNPIVPAAALLIWESLVPFLPALLKKISVIYYLTQLCP